MVFFKFHNIHNVYNRKGFTLIELLVVISIIGMLSSVVMAGMQSARERSRFAAGQRFATHTRSALYADALVYFDFDTALGPGAVPNLGSAVPYNANQPGLGNNGGVYPDTYPVTFVSDTDLKKGGKNMKVLRPASPTGGQYPFVWYENSANTIKNTIGTRNYTYSLWYRPDTSTCALTSGMRCVLVGTGNDGNYTGIKIHLNSNNSTYVDRVTGFAGGRYDDATFDTATTDMNLENGKWVHIAFSVTPSVQKLYINGAEVDTKNVLQNNGLPLSTSGISIGGVCCGDLSAGLYDDVAFYSRALAASDIKKMYAQGLAEHGLATKDE